MKIRGHEICDETMHVQIVEGEAVSMLTSKTGVWRSVRPVLEEGLAPCSDACPADIRIPRYIHSLADGRVEEAWEILRQNNPLAAITGRVCPCFCEHHCNRAEFDQAIAIKHLERLLGDYGLSRGFDTQGIHRRKQKIAVIGSGPAGLSAAYYLTIKGYQVIVFESMPEPGGMLRWGIPEYRLPKEVVANLIDAIQNLGVEIKTNVIIGRELGFNDVLKQGYEALVIAVGAWNDLKLNVAGEDYSGVITGLEFLRKANSGKGVTVGDTVYVIGGGNTAIDSARVAARLGAKRVGILYRRSRMEMPAIPDEVEASLRDGVEIQFLVTPSEIVGKDGKACGLRCVRMQLGGEDGSGRRRPIPIPGSEFEMEADMVIIAIGQTPDVSFLEGLDIEVSPQGTIPANTKSMETNLSRVFVAGDVQTGPATVIQAVAAGKKAAIGIHSMLNGTEDSESVQNERVVHYENLNLNYFTPEPRRDLEEADIHALENAAIDEARRCFHCGSCNACNICWFMCPDAAILERDGKIAFDYDYCKGCGLCSEECPRGALIVEEENKWQ